MLSYKEYLIESDKTKEEKLKEVGEAQRGEPETIMLKVQHAMVGGVLNPVVEHLGDLTHRMTLGDRSYAGYEFVKDKVEKGLKWLTSGYGFDKEFRENVASTARYKDIPENKMQRIINKKLREYAEAHSKIPVYNEAQRVARQVAIDVGNQEWDSAVGNLRKLEKHLSNPEEWVDYAHEDL